VDELAWVVARRAKHAHSVETTHPSFSANNPPHGALLLHHSAGCSDPTPDAIATSGDVGCVRHRGHRDRNRFGRRHGVTSVGQPSAGATAAEVATAAAAGVARCCGAPMTRDEAAT
jgi:hypothetical protein